MFKLGVTNRVPKPLSLNQLPCCVPEKENYRTLDVKLKEMSSSKTNLIILEFMAHTKNILNTYRIDVLGA